METNDTENKILSLIKISGPCIPSKIAKAIESNILIASAHLSELSARGVVKISNVKNDGTPFYYLKGQEEQLQQLSNYLNDKDQRAFNLLKDKEVLRDKDLEPLIRVGMRAIKDFAVPLNVKTNQGSEIFWKWYLITNEDATKLIRDIIDPEAKRKIEDQKKQEAEKIEEDKKKKDQELKQKIAQEKKKRDEEIKKKIEKEKAEEKALEEKRKLESKKIEEQKKLDDKKQVVVRKRELKPDAFLDQLNRYFKSKGIDVLECEVVRKNADIDLILRIPSVVGKVDYYCKAKNKKRVMDGDLSSAYIKGQMKKLPVIFLTTGHLTKKAHEMLSKDLNNGIVLKKI